MSRREKLLEKMRSTPGKIRFSEAEALVIHEGSVLFNARGSHRTDHRGDGRVLTNRPSPWKEEDMPPRRHPETPGRTGVLTTSHDYRGYVFTITYRPRDPAYTVDYPDFPDIITSGASLAEAFAHACEALDLHLETLAKLGYVFPKAKHRLVVETSST